MSRQNTRSQSPSFLEDITLSFLSCPKYANPTLGFVEYVRECRPPGILGHFYRHTKGLVLWPACELGTLASQEHSLWLSSYHLLYRGSSDPFCTPSTLHGLSDLIITRRTRIKIVARVSNRRSMVETLPFTLLWVFVWLPFDHTPSLDKSAVRICACALRSPLLGLVTTSDSGSKEGSWAFGCFVGADI